MENQFIDNYDDSEAVAFILNYLPVDLKEKFTEDDIYYILDVCEDYYEQSNFFETDDETEERELIEYIVREAAKNKMGKFVKEDVLFVLRGEEAYFELLYNNANE